MSFELNGTHASALLSSCPLLESAVSSPLVPPLSARLGVPSELQKEHPRQRHVIHIASARAGSHELLQAIVETSPAMPEWQEAEHMRQLRHLQSLHWSTSLQNPSHCS